MDITSSKNDVDPAIMNQFRPGDRNVRPFGDSRIPSYLIEGHEEPVEDLEFIYYAAPVSVIRDRLELEGDTVTNCRRLFGEWRTLEIQQQEAWEANGYEHLPSGSAEHEQIRDTIRESRKADLQNLRNLTVDSWLDYFRQILEHHLTSKDADTHKDSQLVQENTFTGADFSIQQDGVCRLNPELARRVAQLALEDYGSAT